MTTNSKESYRVAMMSRKRFYPIIRIENITKIINLKANNYE
jgi:hypothetical protein